MSNGWKNDGADLNQMLMCLFLNLFSLGRKKILVLHSLILLGRNLIFPKGY